jgi:hypothetical protein
VFPVAGEVVSHLGEQLKQAGMLEVFAIPRARMPVVKFVHPDTGELSGLQCLGLAVHTRPLQIGQHAIMTANVPVLF